MNFESNLGVISIEFIPPAFKSDVFYSPLQETEKNTAVTPNLLYLNNYRKLINKGLLAP